MCLPLWDDGCNTIFQYATQGFSIQQEVLARKSGSYDFKFDIGHTTLK